MAIFFIGFLCMIKFCQTELMIAQIVYWLLALGGPQDKVPRMDSYRVVGQYSKNYSKVILVNQIYTSIYLSCKEMQHARGFYQVALK